MRKIIKTLFSASSVAISSNSPIGTNTYNANAVRAPWTVVTIISGGVSRIRIAI